MMTKDSESFAKWFNPLQDYLELPEKNPSRGFSGLDGPEKPKGRGIRRD